MSITVGPLPILGPLLLYFWTFRLFRRRRIPERQKEMGNTYVAMRGRQGGVSLMLCVEVGGAKQSGWLDNG